MSKVIINIPDSYPRVEGIVELFGKGVDGGQLPYLNAYLDHDLLPGDVVEITPIDPVGCIESVGGIKIANGVVVPVVNCK